MRSRLRRCAAVVAALALLVPAVACSSDDTDGADAEASPASESTPAPTTATTQQPDNDVLGPGQGLRRYVNQPAEWADCGGGFECATVLVPLDYDNLTGDTVGLAVNRLAATDPDARIGSLLVNPGGPGGSGVDFVQQAAPVFSGRVRARYDLVGFDPRGVGASEPLECVGDGELDELLAADPDPDTDAEVVDVLGVFRDFTQSCVQAAPELLPHLSTVDVARDLDVIRAVLGDRQLHYVGFSYGTLIGAVYAELFPERVARMVLDGAVDPALDAEQAALSQAGGFQTALEAYAADCVDKPGCPLGTDADIGLETLRAFFEDLDADPLPTDDPERPLTEALGLYGVLASLYSQAMWPGLTLALTAALEDGDGNPLLTIVDVNIQRFDDGYAGNGQQVIYAVNCLDRPSDVTVADVEGSVDEFEQVAPTVAASFAWGSVACGLWPVQAASPLPEVIDAEGAAPIVVVGTTRDPATPYEQAQALADDLDSGVLLSRDGDGHTAFGAGNECIDSAIDAYLVDGIVPADGTSC